jgi:predicted acylesterase/phospholipase RssA
MMRNIGLAFSGGGFRAASFALGTMSYLHRIQWDGKSLLEHVSYISGTSGGSIADAYYTLGLHQGKPIPTIFEELYHKLKGYDILEKALDTLTKEAAWKSYPHKTRNLINALAIAFDRHLFDGQTFAKYWDKRHRPHVHAICINATELNNGISFRFKIDGTDAGISQIGNHYLKFKGDAVDVCKSLRVADAVAASCCYPSGFEPMVFPEDFANPQFGPSALQQSLELDHINHLHRRAVKQRGFGLMDGGIVDNQGLYGLRIEDHHRRKSAEEAASEKSVPDEEKPPMPFDLMIHCDVASYLVNPYGSPNRKWSPWLRMRLRWLLLALGLILPLTLATLVTFALQDQPWYYYLLISPAYFSSVLIGIGIYHGLRLWIQNRTSVPTKMLRRYLKEIIELPLSAFVMVAKSRVKSFSMLAQDVFFKQIRRLHLEIAYNDERNRNRIIPNFIYELSIAHHHRRRKSYKSEGKGWWADNMKRMEPSQKMERTAETARKVATTLWFDPRHGRVIDSVIATGQFTMCHNLIKHLSKIEQLQGKLQPELETLRTQMLADWDHFLQDPKFMLSQIKGRQAGGS